MKFLLLKAPFVTDVNVNWGLHAAQADVQVFSDVWCHYFIIDRNFVYFATKYTKRIVFLISDVAFN